MTVTLDQARVVKRKMADDPVWKTEHVFGFWSWSKQREILRAVREHPRVAVRSAHGVGKTAIAARVVLDWLTEARGIVVTTAPTWHQVEHMLWKEIATAVAAAKIPIGGKLTNTRLEIDKDWVAYGLSTDQPERFQGEHSPRLLLVVDEASGVDESIYKASKGYLTAAGAHVLLIGNPTKMHGTFFEAFRPDSRYRKIHISAFDTPAFTGEEVPADVLRALPTVDWQEEMLEELGEDDPEYRVRVLGEFAPLAGRPVFNSKQMSLAESLIGDPWACGLLLGTPVPNGQLSWQDADRGPTKVYAMPIEGHSYVMFADVAGGVSEDEVEARISDDDTNDFCAAIVVDLTNGKVVCEFQERTDADLYAAELARIGWLYRSDRTPALLAVEVNNAGVLTISKLRDTWGYPNLYKREVADDKVKGKKTRKLGWRTDMSTRPAMIAVLKGVLRDHPEALSSKALLAQMRMFVWNEAGTKAEAEVGAHDDLVIAAAGAFSLFQQRAQMPVSVVKPKGPVTLDDVIRERQKATSRKSIAQRAPRAVA